jgi:hypothetical protein
VSPVVAVQLSIAFVWLGMVLAISFLEAPIKFRAPGITIPLGVGIGRLVFRALNAVETVFALVMVATLLFGVGRESWWRIGLVGGVCVVLVAGAGIVRPAMDRRVRQGPLAEGVPSHPLHRWYVFLECGKVLLLLAIGLTAFTA